MVSRIIPASFEPRELYEVSAFYIAWLLSLLISFSCSIRKGIIIMLYITAAVLLLIPVISVVLVPETSLLNSLKSVHWSLAGVDLALILLGLFYLVVLRFYQTKFITLERLNELCIIILGYCCHDASMHAQPIWSEKLQYTWLTSTSRRVLYGTTILFLLSSLFLNCSFEGSSVGVLSWFLP